jgi:PAS domain S-box-containing protein
MPPVGLDGTKDRTRGDRRHDVHEVTSQECSSLLTAVDPAQLVDALFEHSPDAVVLSDRGSGQILKVNAAFCAIIGYAPEELLGRRSADLGLIPSIGRPQVPDGAQHDPPVAHVQRKDGELRLVEHHCQPVSGSELLLTFVRDVTASRAAEESLRVSEEHHRLLIDTVSDYAIFMLDPEGQVASWNPGAQRLKGYTAAEVIGRHFSIFYTPENIAAGRPDYELQRALGEGIYEESGWRVRKDGTQFWANLTITPIRDSAGAVRGFAKVTHDDTTRTLAEDALRESETRFRQLIETIRESFVLRSADPLEVLYASPSVEDLLGISLEQVYADPLFILPLIHPGDRERAFSVFRPSDGEEFDFMVTDPAGLAAPTSVRAGVAEVRIVRPDGQLRWLRLKVAPLRDRSGTLTRFATSMEDITAEMATREALQSIEARFRAVFETSLDGILITTPEGDVLSVNAAMCRMLGRTEAELIEGDRSAILDVSDERLQGALEERERHGHMRTELSVVRADGSRLPVELTSSVFEDTDGGRKMSVFVRDTTDLKAHEAALQAARAEAEHANAAKSQFLSRMSHELRTPLNSILGFGQLLGDQPLNERQARYVHRIMSAGRHLLTLIDEVLDISRLESGMLTLSPELTDLTTVVADAVALVEPLATARAITIDNLLPTDDLPVLADVQRLKQVLLNVLFNAIKYNHDGGAVSVAAKTRGDRAVRVIVTDTGPGIPTERAGDMFTPFNRLGAEDTEVPGTGLGLALSKSLIEAMGGAIGFANAPGDGARFWIELRRGQAFASAQPSLTFSGSSAQASGRLAGRTILLIEDNVVNHELIAEAFTPQVRLLTAIQGQVGIELAHAHQPDLILLDLHLPDLDGGQVLASLKSDPATARIPVIVISADAAVSQQARLLAGGAEAYLPKPLDLHGLLVVVAEAIDGSAARWNPLGESVTT